jgi:hypothetical protein
MGTAIFIGDRLGFAGLIVGLLGIALMYLVPNKKWIGWVALILAAALGVAWGITEIEKPLAGDCQQIAHGSQLMKYADKYKVGFVCGIIDPTVDKFDDNRIAVSQAFSIHPGDIRMAVHYSPLMIGAVGGVLLTKIPGSVQNGALPPVKTWSEEVLFPKNAKPSDIHQLSDIPKQGGIILSQVEQTR